MKLINTAKKNKSKKRKNEKIKQAQNSNKSKNKFIKPQNFKWRGKTEKLWTFFSKMYTYY